MKVTYTSTYKLSAPHFNRLHELLTEAIKSVDNVSFARIELDRIRGFENTFKITAFLFIGKEIISIHSEGTSQLEAIQYFYKEVYAYNETGLMRLFTKADSFAA